ncbi:2,3-diaminopropionate biosynthesis protein SbnA [Streptomyces sp. YIM B13518]|uniref:2,3-diaminopropionate biosynthesis protein SbnA n=1 Tax=Streptomyces sp. YIM B13518 TaxID=3366316 RepID=UPI0036B1C9A6
MAIISAADELLDTDVYLNLDPVVGINVMLKCEGFNFAGSVKLRTAVSMVTEGIRSGVIKDTTTLVESSSGNLGVALSVVAAARSLRFVCVTDPKCSPTTMKLMKALGSEVEVVDGLDASGGYLAARKRRVRELCEQHADYVCLDQYQNPASWMAHYELTAPLIAKQFPDLDVLFVGAGTGGTLAGCARFFRENFRRVRIVAVDSVGSANFGMPAGPRHIPGLGASETMPFVTDGLAHDLVRVTETDTVRMCRRLARRGVLAGGSTGTVVSGAESWLARQDAADTLTAVALAPDLGDRYLDTLYDDDWVEGTYGPGASGPDKCPPAGPGTPARRPGEERQR